MGERRCPICGEPAGRPDAEPFPFCSRRCKLVDLGNWLGERYRVPEPGSDDTMEADLSGEGH